MRIENRDHSITLRKISCSVTHAKEYFVDEKSITI